MEGEEFLDSMSEYQLVKKDSAPWSYLASYTWHEENGPKCRWAYYFDILTEIIFLEWKQ
jgi:hypothetical protein